MGHGNFDIHRRKDDAGASEELVQTREVGDGFGELALMYNVPRQVRPRPTSPDLNPSRPISPDLR